MFPIEASEKIFAECLWLNFSKVTGEISPLRKLFHVRWYIQKSSSSRNSEKFTFNQGGTLAVYRLQPY